MLDKLEAIKIRFDEVGKQITDPEIIGDVKKFIRLNKEYKDLEPLMDAYSRYLHVIQRIRSAKEVLDNEKDADFRDLAKEELTEAEEIKNSLEEEIRILLIPKDPEDGKSCVMEIRAGTGGDEASLFAGDLFRMYSRYCEKQGWKIDIVDYNEGTTGGYKEIVFEISADGSYGIMKYESGVHRVQRVPATEAQGRIHTSAATVVVLPEADEFDVEIKMNDIRKDTFCSSGAGGQSVNTTYSAVRITHIPTGLVVQCQDERSQIKNFDKALKVLRSRIYEIEYQKRLEETSKKRKTMVSTGDRSAKIRTYNYPQGRVTDHRINYSSYNLPAVMNGEIEDFLTELQTAENAEKLKEGNLTEA
jgi:peptide chain release factor 1